MSNGEKRGPVNRSLDKPPEGPVESGQKPEKLSPAQVLERMQTAQARLEQEEEKRVDGLLEREAGCGESIVEFQARLEEARKALSMASESIAGKKKVSEEYTAGFQELEEVVRLTEDGLQTLRAELDEIKKDPGIIERRRQETKKKQQEAKDAEVKELEDKAKEAEKKVEELAARMIAFLIEDDGWAIDLDKLHLFGYKEVGGQVRSEIDEIQRKLSSLADELNALLPQKEKAKRSWLKVGLKGLDKEMADLANRMKKLQDKVNELEQRAYKKREEFLKIEAELRAAIFMYDSRRQVLKWQTGKQSEGTKIKLSEDFVHGLSVSLGSGNCLANYGIYKPFLKQFGFDVNNPAAKKKF